MFFFIISSRRVERAHFFCEEGLPLIFNVWNRELCEKNRALQAIADLPLGVPTLLCGEAPFFLWFYVRSESPAGN